MKKPENFIDVDFVMVEPTPPPRQPLPARVRPQPSGGSTPPPASPQPQPAQPNGAENTTPPPPPPPAQERQGSADLPPEAPKGKSVAPFLIGAIVLVILLLGYTLFSASQEAQKPATQKAMTPAYNHPVVVATPQLAPLVIDGVPVLQSDERISVGNTWVARRLPGNRCLWWDGQNGVDYETQTSIYTDLSVDSHWTSPAANFHAIRFRSRDTRTAIVQVSIRDRNQAGACVR